MLTKNTLWTSVLAYTHMWGSDMTTVDKEGAYTPGTNVPSNTPGDALVAGRPAGPADQAAVQAEVGVWCDLHYPGEGVRKKFLNLLEEVAELGCVLGVPASDMVSWLAATIAKSDDPVGDQACTVKEVGDVQLSVYNLSHTLQLDAGGCLESVMVVNRGRLLEVSSQRRARKAALGMGNKTDVNATAAVTWDGRVQDDGGHGHPSLPGGL